MIDIKTRAKEISYNALKKGNLNVTMLPEKDVFDILSFEQGSKNYILVKATEKEEDFSLSCGELFLLKSEEKESNYLIHRYRFDNDKVESFNIYKYDKENDMLVDIIDKSIKCTIEPIVNEDSIKHICTPKKLKKEFQYGIIILGD